MRISIQNFGESHGQEIGAVITNFPAGMKIDYNRINKLLDRRRGNKRIEPDEYRFVSGVYEGHTTGAPICVIIKNKDIKSEDYDRYVMRPSHADYSAFVKFGGFNDYRGGGHFSGRLTAPMVVLGSLCLQYLEEKNINVTANLLINTDCPENDSIGGKIEIKATGVPTGLGGYGSTSCESVISSYLFSIPAVKAVEFGLGVEFADSLGSQVNDEYFYEEDKVKLKYNNNGGMLGGITTGEDIIARITIKPTPSIALEQNTINIKTQENVKYKVKGRHDDCIARRIPPIAESYMAFALMELL